ncbi:hypothetical protein [Sphingobium indicum]|uniref:hypothetical protein n=1 Tax=Sphingobium indicum TaxID=332055 RepID=UPI001E2A0ACD|nr:hypothetical protein [Sphingobium indicum]
MTDLSMEQAARLIDRSMTGGVFVHSVFDVATFTAPHVVSDPATGKAASNSCGRRRWRMNDGAMSMSIPV